jgi:hypothetical protein
VVTNPEQEIRCIRKLKKLIIYDLDGTLAESKSSLDKEANPPEALV